MNTETQPVSVQKKAASYEYVLDDYTPKNLKSKQTRS